MKKVVAIASLVAGVAFSANPSLAENTGEVFPDIAAQEAPEYSVAPPKDFADVKLTSAGKVGSQSVAVNPKNANFFAAAYANQGSCWVRTTSNAGRTWDTPKKLPMLTGKLNCAIPALIWAPDGSRIYAAYSYQILDDFDFLQEVGAVVSSSVNNGRTWSSPKIALRYPSDPIIASLRLSTPVRTSDAKWVYLLSEVLQDSSSHTDFARSGDGGRTWEVQSNLVAWFSLFSYASSPSIAGGPGGEILVAWGQSYWDPDGNFISSHTYVKRSRDYGATFSGDVIAVPDIHGDTAIAFGALGTAHLVYTDFWDSSAFGTSYAYSTKAPYTAWSQPVVLSDHPSASHFYSPRLTVSACGSGTNVLHAVWMDDRAGSEKYNVYYTRKVAKGGELWSPNLRVSGTSPITDWGYPLFWPAIASGSATAIGLWGFLNASPGAVWASRIAPGVSCP